MNLALYHPWIYLRGGAERTILELVNRSRHRWTLYTHHYEPDATFDGFARLDVRELHPRIEVRRSFVPLARAAATIAAARLPGSDALLVSSESVGDFIVGRNPRPAAVYCHTPLKILHDPRTRAALRERDRAKSAALRLMAPSFEVVERRAWRRYAHIFANSEEVRSRIALARLAAPGAVEVLHPGVDTDRFAFGDREREPYFCVPGRIMYSKNVELAIDAFLEAHRRGLRARLVVAGAVDAKSEDYLAGLRERAAGLPVTFDLDVSDERMVTLLQRALAVVFPSWNEDFGIVPLESMATGTPVLAVNAGGPRETIRDGSTGWLLPPNAAGFAERMLDVEARAGELAPMRRAARERALEFSWDRFAARVDEVMEQIAANPA